MYIDTVKKIDNLPYRLSLICQWPHGNSCTWALEYKMHMMCTWWTISYLPRCMSNYGAIGKILMTRKTYCLSRWLHLYITLIFYADDLYITLIYYAAVSFGNSLCYVGHYIRSWLEGLDSLRRFLETRDNKQISSDTLTELAEVVLKNNIWIWWKDF